jgi:hypothetical protein
MNNAQYNSLKYTTKKLFLNDILHKSSFLGFYQTKSLSSLDYVELKKQLLTINLNVYKTKKSILLKKINVLSPSYTSINNLVKGNILIVYSLDKSFLETNSLKLSAFLKENIKIIPLYFYVFNQFMTISQILHIIEVPLTKKYETLLALLAGNNLNVINILNQKNLS